MSFTWVNFLKFSPVSLLVKSILLTQRLKSYLKKTAEYTSYDVGSLNKTKRFYFLDEARHY